MICKQHKILIRQFLINPFFHRGQNQFLYRYQVPFVYFYLFYEQVDTRRYIRVNRVHIQAYYFQFTVTHLYVLLIHFNIII